MANDKRWQVEPNLTIVQRLIDLGVLRVGGHDVLVAAAELAQIATNHDDDYPTDAVADRMRRDIRFTARLDDPNDLVIAAGEVVDIVRAHRSGLGASTEDGAT